MTPRARCTAAAAAIALLPVVGSGEALAYRPFDGTDAAVAAAGEVEIEVGPAGYRRQGAARSLIAPAVTLNYGIAEDWEAVLEGEVTHGLAGGPGTAVAGAGAFVKGVLRRGSLQGRPGPSIATEIGVLLPGIDDDPGAGASVAAIASRRWPWVTAHLNGAAAVTRQGHGDLFVGAIIEGRWDWPVRPVAEVFYERELGRLSTVSVLIGAIWQVRDGLSFDAGLRRARVGEEVLDEARAGLTVGFSF